MINFNTNLTKDELVALGEEYDLAVDSSMKKTEIINVIQAYNLTLEEEEELSDSDIEESAPEEEEELSELDTEESTPEKEEELSDSDTEESVLEEEGELTDSDKLPQSKESRGTYVYVGPTLPFGKLVSKSSFIGTRTEVLTHLSAVIEEYPQIKKLIVPTKQVAQMSQRVKSRGNTNYNDFVAVQSAVTQKRKK